MISKKTPRVDWMISKKTQRVDRMVCQVMERVEWVIPNKIDRVVWMSWMSEVCLRACAYVQTRNAVNGAGVRTS